jgi:hypothetical protein
MRKFFERGVEFQENVVLYITSLANSLSYYFRYQLFFLQASSLRRNPFIGIADCSSKKVVLKREAL